MIKHLRIRNFKGWKDSDDLKLAPLTVLFGTNSSGKSSIGQFLMMLKQTTESSDRTVGLHLGGGQRSIVDLGTWEDVVHGHKKGESISFGLKFVATANAHPDKPTILQAVDAKWRGWEPALNECGLHIEWVDENTRDRLYAEHLGKP